MSQFHTQPLVDETDPVQVWLRQQWVTASDQRISERMNGPRVHNVGATIAAHKMQWIKELLTNWQKQERK